MLFTEKQVALFLREFGFYGFNSVWVQNLLWKTSPHLPVRIRCTFWSCPGGLVRHKAHTASPVLEVLPEGLEKHLQFSHADLWVSDHLLDRRHGPHCGFHYPWISVSVRAWKQNSCINWGSTASDLLFFSFARMYTYCKWFFPHNCIRKKLHIK